MSIEEKSYQIQKPTKQSELLYELLDVKFVHDGFCVGMEIETENADLNPGVHIFIGNKGEIVLSIQQMSENVDDGVVSIEYELNKTTFKWELSEPTTGEPE